MQTLAATATFNVTVVMERYPTKSRWQPAQWRVAEVLPDQGAYSAPTALAVDLVATPDVIRVAHPGFPLAIFRDEGEGYYLNINAPEPAIFVVWRLAEDAGEHLSDPAMEALPHSLTLSYNEAARRMDAQEKVDRVPMPPELLETLCDWVAANYQPPQKKPRIRPQSFASKDGRYDGGMKGGMK